VRLEDSLRPDKGNTSYLKRESLRKKRPREDVSVPGDLVRQPFEGCRSYSGIMRGVEHAVLGSNFSGEYLKSQSRALYNNGGKFDSALLYFSRSRL